MGRLTRTDISMAINILSHPQSGDDSDIRKAVADAIEALKEVERLQTELRQKVEYIQEQREVIDDLKAECERQYEQAEADIMGSMADGGTSCHWCMESHKKDTIKRFAKRIVKQINKYFTEQCEIRTEGKEEYPIGLIDDLLSHNKEIYKIVMQEANYEKQQK